MFASCMPRVQLYVNACNGWPQFALQHHWLLPIKTATSYDCTARLVARGIAAVSSAIEESDLYLFYLLTFGSRAIRTLSLTSNFFSQHLNACQGRGNEFLTGRPLSLADIEIYHAYQKQIEALNCRRPRL